MNDSCRDCLARSALIARLAPYVAGVLDGPKRPKAGVLGLPEAELVAALAPGRSAELDGFGERFDFEGALERIEAAGITAACRHGRAYPPQLLDLADPPAALYVAGRLSALEELIGEEPSVTLVGTRAPSGYGIVMARSLGEGLARAGLPVVSGLALGIDGEAHEGCLTGGGTAIAVLAGGPDRPYPRTHADLYRRVRASGAVVSEMPPGQPAYRWSFPARNRIMAALTPLTIVVEAAEPSGSLITSDFATHLNRGVGAVPGLATARMARGNNRLLGDGARLVRSSDDVLDELFGVGQGPPRLGDMPAEPDDPVLKRVLAAVEAGGGPSAIARVAGLSAGRTRAALARLEAGGYIARGRLGSYERRAGRPRTRAASRSIS